MKPTPKAAARLPVLPCACANLRRAARAVTRLYDQELRRSGLAPTQFTLLQALAVAGEVTQSQLGQGLALDSTTLTRTLAPLRRKKWIAIRPGADRRERRLRITSAGRRRLRRAWAYWQKAQERLRRALGGQEWARLQASLLQLARAAQHA